MPLDDLKSYATSTTDFYDLLSLSHNPTQKDLDRAWRRTALKYHPDKVGAADVAAREKFHLAQIGYDVLSDPAVRALYDNARNAREQRRKQHEQIEGKRRVMKDDLEGRERGVKRKVDDAEETWERELRKLAEDGKRRRMQREEALRREAQKEKEDLEEVAKNGTPVEASEPDTVPELDRTIKIRFPRRGPGLELDGRRLRNLFSSFGTVENAFLLKDKKSRVGSSHEKQLIATGVVVFQSIVGAYAAVDDLPKWKGKGDDWSIIDSVFWAAGKEPEILSTGLASLPSARAAASIPSTPVKKGPDRFNGFNTPSTTDSAERSDPGLRRVPSFASFSSATPTASPFTKSAAGSPSLEEIVLIRLRQAEKRRLEEQIAAEDAVAESNGR